MKEEIVDKSQIRQAAQLLIQARSGPKLAHFPAGLMPESQADAQAIQDQVLQAQDIGGWKISAVNPPDSFSAVPLPKASADGSLPRHLSTPELEVEIAIMIEGNLPTRGQPYTLGDVLPALGKACAAFEIVESRFQDRATVPALSVMADQGSSAGVIVGSGTPDWAELDFSALAVSLVDRKGTRTASGNASRDQTLAALVWLANEASRRGFGLRAGQFVMTGARVGPAPVDLEEAVFATVEHIGRVHLNRQTPPV